MRSSNALIQLDQALHVRVEFEQVALALLQRASVVDASGIVDDKCVEVCCAGRGIADRE
jgi:hypothetical protein